MSFLLNIVFGLADNGFMLIGALFGVSIEASLEKRAGNAIMGALLGNAVSDCIAGFLALNPSLAVGSLIGCLLIALIYKITKK